MPCEIFDYFENFDIIVKSNIKINIPVFSIDNMRKLYVVLRKFSDMNIKFDTDEIYTVAVNSGFVVDYTEFLLYFYIMAQLGLIKKGNSDILYVNYGKKDLSESYIYRYIDGKRS